MIKVRSLSAVLALGALAALPGCSMFGGGEQPAPTAAAAPAPAPAPAPEMSPPSSAQSHTVIRRVQATLKSHGMYAARIDGVWGPKTSRGVSEFQQRNSLPVSGELDDATLEAMHIVTPTSSMSSGTMGANPPMGGGMNESGANGTNMPTGGMNNNSMSAPPPMTGPGTGGTAAPAR